MLRIIIMLLIVIGFVIIPAYAQDPQIKMISWVPHTAYKEQQFTTLTVQLYDAKYNPTGSPSHQGSYLNDVDVAIVILNENFDIQFIFQGKTKDDGTYKDGLIIPWNIKNGKYYVETLTWNNDSYAYKSHIMFIDDYPRPDGRDRNNNG